MYMEKTNLNPAKLSSEHIGRDKLIDVYRAAKLSVEELKEFDSYVNRFVSKKMRSKFDSVKKVITGRDRLTWN